MNIYVVTSREGTELMDPMVFLSIQEARDFAKERIFAAATDKYEWDNNKLSPTEEEIKEWCDENQYEYTEGCYFYDGSDAVECMVTKHEI